ncbi:MAG: PaaI family thioesterase [Pseudomonadales bacterium]|nr:PaaI family thioesterase [Pseudomonadales bacterium]MBO7007952.1 PaaI family thioesterase [Pseudomonadales bacterium]
MGIWQDLLDGYINGSVPEPLPNKKLGMGTLDEWKPGFVRKSWTVDADLFHGRALFGGYIAALADQTLGLAAMTVLEDDKFFGTTNMSITYLSPVTGGEFEGRSLRQI